MPPKIRTLLKKLKAAGFEQTRSKGSHRRFVHPSGVKLTVSGKSSADARHYQVAEVLDAIMRVQQEKE